MKSLICTRWLLVAAVVVPALGASGCVNPHGRPKAVDMAHIPPPPAKNGAALEAIWRRQEANAEAADFVINEHDFDEMDGVRLNQKGKDHLGSIAVRLLAGAPFPVVIERSEYALDPLAAADDFNYPIHPDPELDLRRREAIAVVLTEIGVPYADQRVIVGTAYSAHDPSNQAVQNFGRFNQLPRSQPFFGSFGPSTFGGFGGFGGGAFF